MTSPLWVLHLLALGCAPAHPFTHLLYIAAMLCRTIAPDIKVCASMKSLKRGQHISRGATNAAAAQASRRALEAHAATLSLKDMCNSQRKVKVAFVTPYPPRPDGLAQYAANLRASLLAECANLQVSVPVAAPCCAELSRSMSENNARVASCQIISPAFAVQVDIFAIVLDFWNTEKETYAIDTGRPCPSKNKLPSPTSPSHTLTP